MLIGGLMGTGKSTLAMALQRELGWVLHSSDATRKRLAGLHPAQPEAASFGQSLYSQDWSDRTHQALLGEAEAALASGRSVLLDASFARCADRKAALRLVTTHATRAVFIECMCPPEVALQRLAQRWATRIEGGPQSSTEASQASDGRPDLYERQRAEWDAFSAEPEVGLTSLQVETARMLTVSVEQTLAALEVLHFTCWF